MGNDREASLGIAIGQKGVGKSYTTLVMIQRVLKVNKRKVLILDVNNEFGNVKKDQNEGFDNIRAIDLNDVRKWCFNGIIEARRISPMKEGGGNMSLKEIAAALGVILENFQNGLLLIEDITKIISDSLPADLIGKICTQRHVACDVILHFQSVGKMAHPKLYANCNWIRMHKTKDTIDRHEKKFGEDVTHLYLAEKLVHLQYEGGNKRFFVFIDNDMGFITGKFNKQMFLEAIHGYLQDNVGIITREVNKIDVVSGRLIHKDRNTAFKFLVDKYMKDFYGNQN